MSGVHTLKIDKSEPLRQRIKWILPDSDPLIPLTGYTLKVKVRARNNEALPVLYEQDLTVDDSVDKQLSGTWEADIDPETELLPDLGFKNGYAWFTVLNPSGVVVKCILEGLVYIS